MDGAPEGHSDTNKRATVFYKQVFNRIAEKGEPPCAERKSKTKKTESTGKEWTGKQTEYINH